MRRLVAGLFVVSMGVIIPQPSAQALDKGSLSISPEIGSVEKAYSGIPGSRPGAAACRRDISPETCTTLFAQTQSPGCKAHNSAYCDAVALNILTPKNYLDDLFYVNIELSWDKGLTDNKLDIYAFVKEDPLLGPALARNNSEKQPKSMEIYAPQAMKVFMTIVNERGVNTGYKLKVTWNLEDLGADYRPPVRAKSGGFGPSSAGFTSSAANEGALANALANVKARAKERKVLQPGPDGQLQEVALPVLDTGNRIPGNKGGLDPLVTGVVAVLLASGVGLAVFAIRARRKAAL